MGLQQLKFLESFVALLLSNRVSQCLISIGVFGTYTFRIKVYIFAELLLHSWVVHFKVRFAVCGSIF